MPAMDLTRHLVNLSEDGFLEGNGEMGTPAAQLPLIFQGLTESGLDSLTIWFSGWKTDHQLAGLELVTDLYPEIRDQFQSYPVFFLWDSGLLELLQNHMLDILTCSPLFLKLYRKLAKHVARKLTTILGSDAGTGLLRAIEAETLSAQDLASLSFKGTREELAELTDVEMQALQEDLAGDAQMAQLLGEIVAHARQERDTPRSEPSADPHREVGYLSSQILDELLAQSVQEDAGPPGGERYLEGAPALGSPGHWLFATRLLARIVGRFRAGTDHGLAGTTLEEMYRGLYADKIGTFLWQEMKENAHDAYAANTTELADDSFHSGAMFIDLLKQHLDDHESLRVNLVGSSAGCVHICHFVQRAAQVLGDGFQFQNVVFLVPAVDFETFQTGIVDCADRIASFRIFTMEDSYEWRDPVVKVAPIVYPHSLLYLVSGLFAGEPDAPLLGLARHLQDERYLDNEAVRAGRQYLKQCKAPVVYSITADDAPPGQRAGFTSHYGKDGGPSCDRPTLGSLAILIRPAPEKDLHPVKLELTPEIKGRLTPAGASGPGPDAPGDARVPGVVLIPGVPREGQPQLRPRILIGTSEIVDHGIVAGLIKAGRCIARIVTDGVDELVEMPPGKREKRWQEADAAHELRRFYGTGWVLGKARRVLVTNNHILPLPQAARSATAEFGYERAIRAEALPERVLHFSPDDLFFTSPNLKYEGLDYTAVALSEPAPEHLGYLEPRQGTVASMAAKIFVVQHPRGDPKAYVVNHNKKVSADDRYVTYLADTDEGSSGSPLFDERMRLVGIHHVGGHRVTFEGSEVVTNLGSRIEVVIEDLIRQLMAAGWDEPSIRDWFGEGFVLNTWRRLALHP
jgi:hypothetical protein